MNSLTNPFEQEAPLSELWDEAPIESKPHSRLYHLEPIGVDTPFVESLTSYFIRLAAAHSVYPSRLIIDEIAPLIGRRYLRRDRAGATHIGTLYTLYSSGLNGTSTTARDLVKALEQLTLRSDLRFLTLLTWENVLPNRQLLRHNSAWCPVCFEDQRESGQAIYSPLLWAVETVDICAQHRLRLQTHCPFLDCGKSSTPLAAHARPGYCSRCHRWLGSPLHLVAEKLSTPEDEWKWQEWVATNIGELLAVASHVSALPSYEQATTTLASYVDELAEGNRSEFARLTQCGPNGVRQWFQKKQKPQLQNWLQICFHLTIPLVDFFTIPRERGLRQPQAVENHALLVKPSRQHRGFKREQLQNFLEGVLKDEEHEPPSLEEVRHCLGLSKTHLYRFSDLARAITTKHQEYHRSIRQKQILQEETGVKKPRKQWQARDWEKLQQSLEAILADKQRIPPSMREVERQLGYYPGAFAEKFPDLCRAISARYLENRHRESEDRIQMLGQQVRQAMFSLHEQGRYPGIKPVRDQLNNAWLFRDPYTKPVWRETLSELRAPDKKI